MHMQPEVTTAQPEDGVAGGDAEAGPPRLARVGECDRARRTIRSGLQQGPPIRIAADHAVQYDEIVHRVVIHVREVRDDAAHPMRNAILLGECAGHADSRRNCIYDGRVAHTVAEQLDGNATHAGTALEKCCFVESNEGSDDLDQLLCAPGEPMFAEPSRFRARESLTEDLAQSRVQAVTRHRTDRLG